MVSRWHAVLADSTGIRSGQRSNQKTIWREIKSFADWVGFQEGTHAETIRITTASDLIIAIAVSTAEST